MSERQKGQGERVRSKVELLDKNTVLHQGFEGNIRRLNCFPSVPEMCRTCLSSHLPFLRSTFQSSCRHSMVFDYRFPGVGQIWRHPQAPLSLEGWQMRPAVRLREMYACVLPARAKLSQASADSRICNIWADAKKFARVWGGRNSCPSSRSLTPLRNSL